MRLKLGHLVLLSVVIAGLGVGVRFISAKTAESPKLSSESANAGAGAPQLTSSDSTAALPAEQKSETARMTDSSRGGSSRKQEAQQAVSSASESLVPELLGSSSAAREGRPTPQKVRAQAAENPHETPRVVMEFAGRVGELMKAAQASPEAARQASEQLKLCVGANSNEVVESSRALCLMSLEQLSKFQPQIKEAYQKARQAADHRVLLIAQAVDELN